MGGALEGRRRDVRSRRARPGAPDRRLRLLRHPGAWPTDRGTLYLLYRAATGDVDRDMYLLTSDDHGGHFHGVSVHPWRASTCPMSSASLAEIGARASWRPGRRRDRSTSAGSTRERMRPRRRSRRRAVAANRKHPAVAGNARGETILVWTEGTGWQKGGSLAWQVFDRAGRPIGPEGRIDGRHPRLGPGDRRRPARRRVHDRSLIQ